MESLSPRWVGWVLLWAGPPCNKRVSQSVGDRLAIAKQKAVSRFWELLQDVVVLSAVPDNWCAGLPDDHPFLRVVGGAVSVHRITATAQQGGG